MIGKPLLPSSTNCLVLGCHPNPDSFTIAISKELVQRITQQTNGTVHYIDLYRESFNPVLTLTELQQHWSFDNDTQRYIEQLRQSDLIIIIHPVWWATMPALLSGWIQRIFKPEFAFRYEGDEFTQKSARGLFAQKKFLISYLADEATSDASCQTVEHQWRHILQFCAVQTIHFEPIGELRSISLKGRRQAITRVFQRAQELL